MCFLHLAQNTEPNFVNTIVICCANVFNAPAIVEQMFLMHQHLLCKWFKCTKICCANVSNAPAFDVQMVRMHQHLMCKWFECTSQQAKTKGLVEDSLKI